MLTDTQLPFFRALCAPFASDQVTFKSDNGKILTYVKKPALENRLDDVCGPLGWRAEYSPSATGIKCRLHILTPDRNDSDPWVWHWKEDGGGREGMQQTQGQDVIRDEDNDEKSGYTNAFRRVCSVWGMSRSFYGEGVPMYLQDLYPPPLPRPDPAPQPPPRVATPMATKPPQQAAQRQPPATQRPPAPRQAQPRAPQQRPPAARGPQRLGLPTNSKSLYAWCMSLEAHYKVGGILQRCNEIAKSHQHEGRLVDLPEDLLDIVSRTLAEDIRTWDCYNGEFEHIWG